MIETDSQGFILVKDGDRLRIADSLGGVADLPDGLPFQETISVVAAYVEQAALAIADALVEDLSDLVGEDTQ